MRYIGKTSKFIDYPLLITYVVLCLIGLVMVYSASMVAAKGTLTGEYQFPEHTSTIDNFYTLS